MIIFYSVDFMRKGFYTFRIVKIITPRYSCNITEVGTKHQSINQNNIHLIFCNYLCCLHSFGAVVVVDSFPY